MTKKVGGLHQMKISFYTFGCTVNNYETQKMRRLFIENGDQIIETGTADAIIINSCSVTSSADKSSIQLLRRLRNKNPQAVIAIVGCYCESLMRNGNVKIKDADIVLGNDKFDIINQIEKLKNDKQKSFDKPKSVSAGLMPRAFLQIQNGCSNYCSYCIVPYLRGQPVSKSFDDIKHELKQLVSEGYKEIIIAGMNLALYKHMEYTLIDVLKEADSIEGLSQIRLSSLEPATFTDDFMNKLPEIKKLCPQFHISLQSGNNKTLASMNRRYTFEDYLSIITRLRDVIKHASITTDIIVGFPGESDNDFLKSCYNIVKCNFSDIHIFKYSRREGTAAAVMEGQVTEHNKAERSALLQGIKIQTRHKYCQSFFGVYEKVMFLKKHRTGLIEGVTSHNIKVLVDTEDYIFQNIYDVTITGINENGDYLIGKI